MVEGRVAGILLSAVAAGLLSGCGVFSASIFPDAATQLAAQKDLSAEIPADFARDFTLSAVTVGGIDLVVLASQEPYDGPHLLVLDQNLNTLQSLTYQDLISHWGTVAVSPNPTALVGAAGDVLIMGLDCTLSAAGLSTFTPVSSSTMPMSGGSGVTDGTSNYANFNCSGNQLSYSRYSSSWAFVSSSAAVPISSNSSLNFQVQSIQADPARAIAALILQEMSSNQDYYLTIPLSALRGTLSSPLLASYTSFTASAASNQLTAYSQNGFIAFQQAVNAPGGTFIRLAPNGATLPYSLRYTASTDVDMATRAAGGWYYIFDRTTRVLSKINAWWGQ